MALVNQEHPFSRAIAAKNTRSNLEVAVNVVNG
jgi:hypothetical protein